MFEFARAKRSAHPLLSSLVLHSIGALALVTLHFSGGLTAIAERRRPVTLIAPQLIKRPAPLPAPVRSTRVFRPPPIEPLPAHALELPLAVRIEPARAVVVNLPEPRRAEVVAAVLLPPSPVSIVAAPAPPPRLVIKAAGFSTAESVAASAPARSNTPRPSGFGDTPAPASTAPARRPVPSGSFGDTTIAAASAPAPTKPTGPEPFTPVEILNKPRPRYSEEARRLQVEGEVLIEMLFVASGEMRVLRVVRGLGHGLDENALAAAREIRFRPARRGGGPVDSAAIVHIVFQLAY